ncbi:MAG TPA: carboxypeptidase-like regulatory domain-containing protein [Verrucomicrobiae bacterium]|jgi:hypothetical protein|nr:carboxypeptidase-like regulatory domain-containing protein [Verrucomicrobiae bacterium]
MNTRIIAHLLLFALPLGCAEAQTTPSKPVWNATVRTVDESGRPVSGAMAAMSWNVNLSNNSVTSKKVEGLTDNDGVFNATQEANGSIDLGFVASKTGYYPAKTGYALAQLNNNNPEKWNPSVTLMLKKIGTPIPMYVRHVEAGPPVFNKPVGYDLMAGDWISPYGKGQFKDIVFTGKLDEKTKNDFDYRLLVTFPNEGDGIQEFTLSDLERTSGFRSPYEAPVEGYQPEVTKTMSRHPGQETKTEMNNPDHNYFFRVRTVLDERGKVKSALYGKIYGDFMQFTYYLNPTPNDRNVEFDPARNLLGGQNVPLP